MLPIVKMTELFCTRKLKSTAFDSSTVVCSYRISWVNVKDERGDLSSQKFESVRHKHLYYPYMREFLDSQARSSYYFVSLWHYWKLHGFCKLSVDIFLFT